jgi:hypothetical protein
MLSDRGQPEVIIPEAALRYDVIAGWQLRQAASTVMPQLRQQLIKGWNSGPHQYERAVRLLFVEAFLAGKYNELVNDFTYRLLMREA